VWVPGFGGETIGLNPLAWPELFRNLLSQIQAGLNKEAVMTHSQERRTRHDRRMVDCSPPQGWKDRRRTAERRIPALVEHEVSDAEWALYFGGITKAPAQTLVTNTLQLDQASEVLNRIRD
jgi:hypothetical protein